MFPTAGSEIYRNEAGEVTGWDAAPSSEPEYCDQCGVCHAGPCDDEDEDDTELCVSCGTRPWGFGYCGEECRQCGAESV